MIEFSAMTEQLVSGEIKVFKHDRKASVGFEISHRSLKIITARLDKINPFEVRKRDEANDVLSHLPVSTSQDGKVSVSLSNLQVESLTGLLLSNERTVLNTPDDMKNLSLERQAVWELNLSHIYAGGGLNGKFENFLNRYSLLSSSREIK